MAIGPTEHYNENLNNGFGNTPTPTPSISKSEVARLTLKKIHEELSKDSPVTEVLDSLVRVYSTLSV